MNSLLWSWRNWIRLFFFFWQPRIFELLSDMLGLLLSVLITLLSDQWMSMHWIQIPYFGIKSSTVKPNPPWIHPKELPLHFLLGDAHNLDPLISISYNLINVKIDCMWHTIWEHRTYLILYCTFVELQYDNLN